MDYELVRFKYENIVLEVNVSLDEDTVWLTKEDIGILYSRDRSVIVRHINSIYKNNILNKEGTCAKNAHVPSSGKRKRLYESELFNLDVVVYIGNHIRSNITKIFHSWCMDTLTKLKKSNIKQSNFIRFSDESVSLDVEIAPEEETVWLPQNKIALLFETTQQNISLHINNIIEEGELDDVSVHKESLYTAPDGKTYSVSFYNLDMILSVGYRIKSKTAIKFRKWANSVLKDYLIRGYVINDDRATISLENYLRLINKVNFLDSRITKVENNEKYALVIDKLIYDGNMFDAIVLISRIIDTSNTSITLIDPYADIYTLDLFKNKKEDIKLTIITSQKNKLSENVIKIFNESYGGLTVHIDDRFHDRYLIIDNSVFYHLGGSINYLGKRLSQITKVEDEDIIEFLKGRILF